MRIFITGATGFIGKAFCQCALQSGHKLVALVNPSKWRTSDTLFPPGIQWISGRLECIPWHRIKQYQPEVCVHLAWISTPGEYLQSVLNYHFFQWSKDLVHHLVRIGIKYFIGVGTCLEYMPSQNALQEDTSPINSETAYTQCKKAFQQFLFQQAQRNGFNACWGRVFYPYGVGEHPARLCTSVIQHLRRGEEILLKTPHSTKDYIYIDDLAAAILMTVEKQFSGTINWGTGTGVTVRQIADTAAQLVGRPELVRELSPPADDPLGYVVADATRLKALGWRPETTLEAGLAKLLAHLDATGVSQ